jgi:hypothetical protein
MDTQRKAPASVAAESEGQSHSQAPSECPSAEAPSTARLIARRTPPKTGRRHVYLYDVEFDGELVVTNSAEPACAMARVLLARGITGNILMIDGKAGRPRYTVNIEKAARLTDRETAREGPRFVRWKPLKGGDGSPRTSERGQS